MADVGSRAMAILKEMLSLMWFASFDYFDMSGRSCSVIPRMRYDGRAGLSVRLPLYLACGIWACDLVA